MGGGGGLQIATPPGGFIGIPQGGEFGHFEMDVRNSSLDVDVNSLIKGLVSEEPNFFNDYGHVERD